MGIAVFFENSGVKFEGIGVTIENEFANSLQAINISDNVYVQSLTQDRRYIISQVAYTEFTDENGIALGADTDSTVSALNAIFTGISHNVAPEYTNAPTTIDIRVDTPVNIETTSWLDDPLSALVTTESALPTGFLLLGDSGLVIGESSSVANTAVTFTATNTAGSDSVVVNFNVQSTPYSTKSIRANRPADAIRVGGINDDSLATLLNGLNNFTFNVWYHKRGNRDLKTFLSKWGNNQGIDIRLNENRPEFLYQDSEGGQFLVEYGSDEIDSDWHMLSYVYSASPRGLDVYEDAVLLTATATTDTLFTASPEITSITLSGAGATNNGTYYPTTLNYQLGGGLVIRRSGNTAALVKTSGTSRSLIWSESLSSWLVVFGDITQLVGFPAIPLNGASHVSFVGNWETDLDGTIGSLTFTQNTSGSSGEIAPGTPPYIGNRRGDSESTFTQNVRAMLDEVVIVDKSLDQSDITSLYNSGAPNDPSGVVGGDNYAHYRMGELIVPVGQTPSGDETVFPAMGDEGSGLSDTDATLLGLSFNDIRTESP